MLFVIISGGLIYFLSLWEGRWRRRAEASERRAERREALATRAVGSYVWEWDCRTDDVYIAESLKRLIGFGPEFPNRVSEWMARIHPDDLPRLQTSLEDAQAGRTDQHQTIYRIRHADGHWVWIRTFGTVQRDASGRILQMTGIDLDITEQRQAEARLQDSEEMYRTLFEGSPDAVIVIDPDTTLPLAFNRRACEQLGYTAEELPTLRLVDYVADRSDEQLRVRIANTLTHADADFETRLRCKNGEIRDVRELISVMTLGGRTVLLCVAQDITDRKRYEASLLEQRQRIEAQAEFLAQAREEADRARIAAETANAAKSQFLAVMSHELRTPLNSIIGFSEIIKDRVLGPERHDTYGEYAGLIHESGHHLLTLINDILDLSRIESGKVQLHFGAADLRSVIDDCQRLLSDQLVRNGLRIAVTLPDRLPTLHADERAIKQCLVNLLTNAIKFTGPGGEIRVSAREVEPEALEIAVSDTGCGIPAEALERIMRPFEQADNAYARSSGGSGIGLAVVKSLVDLHNGAVTIDSIVDVGTTVRLCLPLKRGDGAVPAGDGPAADAAVFRKLSAEMAECGE
ncbi:MAG: PAS domain S-box protein [Rhodospirillaceae bacterium]|nr:PAS domain S-box protein [Rhodospirillaceae bacterium]